jgi:hypothetical protein
MSSRKGFLLLVVVVAVVLTGGPGKAPALEGLWRPAHSNAICPPYGAPCFGYFPTHWRVWPPECRENCPGAGTLPGGPVTPVPAGKVAPAPPGKDDKPAPPNPPKTGDPGKLGVIQPMAAPGAIIVPQLAPVSDSPYRPRQVH